MKKQYVDGPHGQIHLRRWDHPSADMSPLICLPPSPYSSIAYSSLAPLLAKDRTVLAIDYPGYGNSDPTSDDATITDYANAAHAVTKSVFPDQPADLLGFHTGCLVAVETALNYPERVNRLVLIDIPNFPPDVRDKLAKEYGAKKPIQQEVSMLEDAWNFSVTMRLGDTPLQRAYEMFVDQISSGENVNAAFGAAFSYPCEENFPKVKKTTIVVATQSSLLDGSRLAAETISEAKLIEVLEVKASVLEQAAPTIAKIVDEALNGSD